MKTQTKFLVILLIITGTLLRFTKVGKVFAIANPSANYCIDKGYEYETRTDQDGGQYGVCIFPNGSECIAWDYYCNCTKDTSVCSPSMISRGEENCSYPCDCNPVNGGWSEWSGCGEDCVMKRTCTNPTPSCQGDPCEGPSSKSCTGGNCVVCGDSVCSDSENVENCPNDCKLDDNKIQEIESIEDEKIIIDEERVDSDERQDNESVEEEEITVDEESREGDENIETENSKVISDLSDIPWWAWSILGVSVITTLIISFVFVWRYKMKTS